MVISDYTLSDTKVSSLMSLGDTNPASLGVCDTKSFKPYITW